MPLANFQIDKRVWLFNGSLHHWDEPKTGNCFDQCLSALSLVGLAYRVVFVRHHLSNGNVASEK